MTSRLMKCHQYALQQEPPLKQPSLMDPPPPPQEDRFDTKPIQTESKIFIYQFGCVSDCTCMHACAHVCAHWCMHIRRLEEDSRCTAQLLSTLSPNHLPDSLSLPSSALRPQVHAAMPSFYMNGQDLGSGSHFHTTSTSPTESSLQPLCF